MKKFVFRLNESVLLKFLWTFFFLATFLQNGCSFYLTNCYVTFVNKFAILMYWIDKKFVQVITYLKSGNIMYIRVKSFIKTIYIYIYM